MSEKTLSEMIGTLRRQSLGTAERDATVEMIEARIRMAEAAEAYAAWVVDVPPQSTTLDIYLTGEQLLREYVAAREAVRKLEEQA